MNTKIIYINIYSFLTALFYAVIVYYGSTFLSNIIGTKYVWLIYSLAAVFTIISQLTLNKLLHKVNINKLVPDFSLLVVLNLFLLFILQIFSFSAFYQNILIAILFAFYIASAQSMFLLASTMLEDLSKDNQTGKLRGLFITMTSMGYLLGPFLAKIILENSSQKYLFLVSAIIASFTYILFKAFIKKIPEITIHKETNFKQDLKNIWANISVRNILLLQVLVEIFYAGFVIYAPLKLALAGVSISVYLSILVPLGILAFLIVPPWLGQMEDKFKNEKIVLFIAFISLSVVVSILSFTNTNSILVWGILIFLTRIFASSVETSTSSYLFKKINVKNTSVIASYSLTQPVAHFIAPLVFGSVFLLTENYDFVFLSLAIIMFLAIYFVFGLENSDESVEENNISKKILKRLKK